MGFNPSAPMSIASIRWPNTMLGLLVVGIKPSQAANSGSSRHKLALDKASFC